MIDPIARTREEGKGGSMRKKRRKRGMTVAPGVGKGWGKRKEWSWRGKRDNDWPFVIKVR